MRFLPGQIIRSFYICCGKTKEDQPVENPGVVKGRLPLKLYSGSDGMHVRTDENLQVFVLCGICCPGANARGKTRENSKKWRPATFSTLSRAAIGAARFYNAISSILFFGCLFVHYEYRQGRYACYYCRSEEYRIWRHKVIAVKAHGVKPYH